MTAPTTGGGGSASLEALWNLHRALLNHLLAIMNDPDRTLRASTLGVVRQFLSDNGIVLTAQATPAQTTSVLERLAASMSDFTEEPEDEGDGDEDQGQDDSPKTATASLDDDAGESGSLLNKPFPTPSKGH